MSHKLLIEAPSMENIEYVVEEKNLGGGTEKRMWITGEYMMCEDRNRNGRVYKREEMAREINRYNKEFIKSIVSEIK